MADISLNGMRVAVLVTDGFEEVEMVEPRAALDRAGATTVLIAPRAGKVQAFHHHDKGNRFDVDQTLDQAEPDSFDAVLLPGGVINADALRVERKAQEFIRRIDESGKPIAVICHGAWLLVSARRAHGRTLTSYHTLRDDLVNAGAHWVDEETVRDRNWISSRAPKDLPAFNKAMLELFGAQARGRKAA